MPPKKAAKNSKIAFAICNYSLIPRPPPRFYLAAVEIFLHSCKIKSGRRPGNEASNYNMEGKDECVLCQSCLSSHRYCAGVLLAEFKSFMNGMSGSHTWFI